MIISKDKYFRGIHCIGNNKICRICKIVFTFCLVSYGWMFFYAPNIEFIISVTKGYAQIGIPFIPPSTIFFFAIGLLILVIKEVKDEFFSNYFSKYRKNGWPYVAMKYAIFAILVIFIIEFGVLDGGQFIYFKY